ncbi:MAG: hypothetical protein IPK00_15930 [Deltaproteobacteria bacterium]|nr:hypothetical protein [Deltaproteobacteria bacterium]
MSAPSEALASRTLSDRLGIRPAIVELGPTHPSVRRVLAGAGGTASFLVTLDDDRIEALEVEIGLGHRGFEKEVESRPWLEALPYVARLGYASGPIAQVAYCLALERLAGLAVAERTTWQRTLVCELARATDHLARVAALATAIGASRAERIAQEGELVAAALLEASIGGGPLRTWSWPGGVASDLPFGFDERWQADRARIARTLDALTLLLLEHPSAVQRLVDVAPLSAADARAFAVTGPALRAAGIARDLRRDAPQLAYAALEFEVPVGTRGDDYDRLAVVVEEIRQSLRMGDQCIERLAAMDREAARPPLVDGESCARLFVAAGEVELALESATGELGFYLVSDGGPTPRRLRCRAPSFFHAQALPAVLVGARLDDLLPTAALFHLVSGECDR